MNVNIEETRFYKLKSKSKRVFLLCSQNVRNVLKLNYMIFKEEKWGEQKREQTKVSH